MQLSVRDVAGLLNVSGNTVYQWIKTGQLSAQQVNGRYRFNRSELLEWATARNLTIRNGLFDERADEPILNALLSEALEVGGVFHDVPGTDKPSVLKAVVERMQLPDDVDRNFLCSVLLAREAMGSTAIGDGVAIPHVRNPIVLHVLKPTIALCFLRQPIDFDALDKKPVHALFSMVSPTIRIHLHLLSRLAFALRDPKIKELISSQGARDEILNEIRRLETRMSDPRIGKNGIAVNVPLILVSVSLLFASGLLALIVQRSGRLASALGVGGCVAGCLVGLIPVICVLAGGAPESFRAAWNMPLGSFYVQLDSLSAFFLLPVLVLALLASIYGREYLAAWRRSKPIGLSWMFFNLLTASMIMVIIARNALLFLLAWEIMALASFFLVIFEEEREDVRRAGWIYLVATHIGTAFLLVMFILFSRGAANMDFDQFSVLDGSGKSWAGVLFVLAMIGFGTKAGFIPLHVWLPEAHPAAPSHVSALMSGVMIKTGIYGLLRILTFLGPPPAWWGWALIAVGLTSGIPGVLFALAQHDLKRLLAYHSVENIGIIALGLGLGLLGIAYSSPALAVLGFAGGLLHVLNHAVFKGLLFLGAGAVTHAAGTRDIERLGGLLKKMPWTGATFLVGAVAISGLPPLNGFVSEFLIYLAALNGVLSRATGVAGPAVAVIAGLGLIGGLAAACFAKAFGIVFQGEPRSQAAADAHEVGMAMRVPMLILAALCVLIGLLAPLALAFMARVLEPLINFSPELISEQLSHAAYGLTLVIVMTSGLLVTLALLTFLRKLLLARRPVAEAGTWDCGYLNPAPRMQYTASSFADPLTRLFRPLLRTRTEARPPEGLFPGESDLHTETPDIFIERIFTPFFNRLNAYFSRLRWIQQGRLQLYVLYIALTLLILLIWQL